MSKDKPTNLVASIRQRLLNLAHERDEEFQLLLIHYGLERLLYRLSRSPHDNNFLLKGALLFQLWTQQPHRSTLDVDLLGWGDISVERFEAVFRTVCAADVEDDGLRFPPDAIRGEETREEQRYAGVRIHGLALLGKARIPIQIDVGFGDAVTLPPEVVYYPTLLGQPAPVLRAYPKETVIAEKYEAMVSLGIANSRMKDFFDVGALATGFAFAGKTLNRAIQATFERRGTALPEQLPLAFTPEFFENPAKRVQWRAFVGRIQRAAAPSALDAAVGLVRDFLWPATQALVQSVTFNQRWLPKDPWRPEPPGPPA